MGLSNIKTIVVLTPQKLRAVKIGFKENMPVVEQTLELPFSEATLASDFTRIKKELQTSSCRILLPESKTYLELLKFVTGEATRNSVFAKLVEEVPEEITRECFDWKTVKRTEKTDYVQAIALSKHTLHLLGAASKASGLAIEAMEPVSFALARLTRGEKDPHLVYVEKDERVLAVAHQGEVFESVVLETTDDKQKKIAELTEFVVKKWGVTPAKTFDQQLDPVVGLAIKDDMKGSDETTLNLLPLFTPEESETGQEEQPKKSSMKYIVLAVVVIIAALIPIGLVYMLTLQNPTPAMLVPTKAPTQIVTTTPEPIVSESAALQRQTLSILLANGSGVSGEAQRAKTFLEGIGYANITIGNADSFDYQETVVSVKEGVRVYQDTIVADLSSDYVATASNLILDTGDTNDVSIIIGIRKP